MTALGTDRVAVTLDRARVVDGVTLALEPGEWVGLIGPNGGQDDAPAAIAGLVPYDGSIALDGAEVASLAAARRCGGRRSSRRSPSSRRT